MREQFIEIRENRYKVAYVSDRLEQGRGMSGLDSFDPYAGMLFDFAVLSNPTMTPRGLKIVVDLAFIKEDGTIVQLTRLDPSNGLTRASENKVRYALEVPKGFFEENNIKVGDTVVL